MDHRKILRDSGLYGENFILSIVRNGDGFFVTLQQVQ